jgi:hypothetical protein
MILLAACSKLLQKFSVSLKLSNTLWRGRDNMATYMSQFLIDRLQVRSGKDIPVTGCVGP